MSAPPRLILRPYRWFVLLCGGVATAVTLVITIHYTNLYGISGALEGLIFVLAAVAGSINYLYFCYVELGDASIRRVNAFGMRVVDVPVAAIERVSLSIEVRAIPMRVPVMVLHWRDGTMKLYFDRYPERALLHLAEALRERGVKLASELEEALGSSSKT